MTLRQRLVEGRAPKLLQYFWNIGVHLSQTISVLLGGDPDETTSSRCGKAAESGRKFFKYRLCPLIDFLLGEPGHCLKAIERDEGRKQVWDWTKK